MTRSSLEAVLHEAEVSSRFDQLRARFKREVGESDVRLDALRRVLGPLPGRRVLDLGCGKGRFGRRLRADGADVVGVDLSAGMLAEATGLDRVRASARRLPFADRSFDAVAAVEVFQHLARVDEVLGEVARVLRPGGTLAVVDRNALALDPRRPWLPGLAVKWLDERRGRWMYPAGGPVRERWFGPELFRRRLARSLVEVRVEYLLSPDEAATLVFRRLPGVRRMILWTARAPGGDP
jgi:2-polyprenyl-6-hydroxyphenyl methylase/3-demethylubiquinone-9 3-methyltransferase